MRKLKILFMMTVMALSIGSTNMVTRVHASDSEQGMEEKIQEEIKTFLKESDKSDLADLTQEESAELINLLDGIKSQYINAEEEHMKSQLNERASTSQYIGRLFLTLDESTKDLPHGHAGIGDAEVNAVIEANPGVGVKKYSNRIATYWSKRKDSGIYGVRGASSTQYRNARNYANARLGYSYGFNPISDKDFYCSELVFYAWKGQGYTLNSGIPWGTIILPVHIMADEDVYCIRKF